MRILKTVIILFLITNPMSCSDKKVVIEGFALYSNDEYHPVEIVVNDTLRKFNNSNPSYVAYEKFFVDNPFVDSTDQYNRFKISAKKSDSIYFNALGRISQVYLVSDLIAKEEITIKLEPEICNNDFDCDDNNKEILVFVGKKIDLTQFKRSDYCEVGAFDRRFEARYKLVEKIYGEFNADTIEFSVLDHYGKPKFGNYENVLLYVVQRCGKYLHAKYQFHPVFKTIEGKWAAPYQLSDFEFLDSDFPIKPHKIEFADPRIHEITKNNSAEWLEDNFPSPYYEIKDGFVIAKFGNYLNELFELKKQTVLKSRGYFE